MGAPEQTRSPEDGAAAPAPRSRLGAIRQWLKRGRAPVLLQATTTECGAACLAMIVSYHGRAVSVSECRHRFGVGRDGVKAKALLEAARDFGLRARAFSVDLDHLEQIRLPAVAYWKFNHFVVVERWSRKRAEIVDPAAGRRTIERDEFGKNFTGVVLTFEPGPEFRPGGAHRSLWWTLLRRLAGAPGLKGAFAQVLGASLLMQLFALGLPLLTKVLVDTVLPLRLTGAMAILAAGMVVLALSQLLMGYLRATLLVYMQGRFDERVVLGFFEHMFRLPFSFFQQRTSGDLLARLGSSAMLRELLTNQALSVILDGTLVVVCLALLLILAPSFGALTVGIGLLQVLLVVGTAGRVRDLAQKHLVADAESQGFVVQALKGIPFLKASAAEDLVIDYWSHLFFRVLNLSMQRNRLSALLNAGLGGLRTFAALTLLLAGAARVLDGSMTLGTMLALNAVAAAFLAPLSNLVATVQQLQIANAHLARIVDVLETDQEKHDHATREVPRLAGRIELADVSFRYDPGGPLVLQNVSVTVEPGQKVAIVGRTGSGKSSLGLLLLGLCQPSEGRILFDGIPLSELDLRKVRRQFGVVLQEAFVFSGTIRDNIALNDPAISFDTVVQAARLAAIDEEIQAMPMRYDTWLSEAGGLSGGQRQRLCLARALAPRPAILFLDEATSHLDVMTEARVDESLSNLDCTRIVIAHRLSTIRNADLILVLDAGKVIERGTHDELVARGGHYAALVRGQAEARPPGPLLGMSGDATGAGSPAEPAHVA